MYNYLLFIYVVSNDNLITGAKYQLVLAVYLNPIIILKLIIEKKKRKIEKKKKIKTLLLSVSNTNRD